MASIIVAIDENNGIGYKGELLAHIPEDMERFKKLTVEGGHVIMGKKTYESLPIKPLPYRKNYIITSSPKSCNPTDQIQAISLEEAINLIKLTNNTFMEKSLFIIGGGTIYKELLPYCKDIYLTKILKSYKNVDAYFPLLEDKDWFRMKESSGESNGVTYEFWHYRRIS